MVNNEFDTIVTDVTDVTDEEANEYLISLGLEPIFKED